MPTKRTNNVSGGTITRTVCLPIAVAALACIPLATMAQPLDTPGVTSPLTAAQIARENPPNALTGAAVDKPVVLKSAGEYRFGSLSWRKACLIRMDWYFYLTGTPCSSRNGLAAFAWSRTACSTRRLSLACLTWTMSRSGGLQDVVLHPDFAKNHFLYISYSKNRLPQLGTTLAVARARYDQGRLTDVKEILVTEAWESPLGTYGGRMIFGPDGMLYISVGDRDGTTHNDLSSARPQAQSLASHIGKILRVRDDGSIPADNPFVKDPKAKGEIYSYGHRNVYGIAWDPKTGKMWTSEFGPAGG